MPISPVRLFGSELIKLMLIIGICFWIIVSAMRSHFLNAVACLRALLGYSDLSSVSARPPLGSRARWLRAGLRVLTAVLPNVVFAIHARFTGQVIWV